MMEWNPHTRWSSTAGASPQYRDEKTPHGGRRPSLSTAEWAADGLDPSVSRITLLISCKDVRIIKFLQVGKGVLRIPRGVWGTAPESASSSSRKRHSLPLANSAESSRESAYAPTERGPGSDYTDEYLRLRLNLPSSSEPVSLASVPADAASSAPITLLAIAAIHEAQNSLTSREICTKLSEEFPGLGLGEVSYQYLSFKAATNVLCNWFPGRADCGHEVESRHASIPSFGL